ncbi:HsmA family protein [Brevibacterium paucivorans]|uniref:TIGR03987 family protein n=1 Tax=Brevibacterium paucivorans TaxID=170994 RepID=A0A2N6VM35_9MICO|nr:HsmA family protein [Brevibacterium paucivorans]PMD05210.1 TIGR03987 family protein [Brevibacterium paucivorans]
MLIFAIAFITAALVFYTMGVWAEHKKKVLTWPHVILFGLGLVCDATGTEFMRRIAQSDSFSFGGEAAQILGLIMAVTGALALLLMAIHFVWALYVMTKGSDRARAVFHKFSLVVWGIWLVPYFTGMVGGML